MEGFEQNIIWSDMVKVVKAFSWEIDQNMGARVKQRNPGSVAEVWTGGDDAWGRTVEQQKQR